MHKYPGAFPLPSCVLFVLPYCLFCPDYSSDFGDCVTLSQALPLSQDVERISPAAAAAIVLDVQALCNWVMPHVSQSPDVRTSLAELRESVELMTIQDPAAFFDPTSKAEHYPHVDLEKGKVIVDKVFGDRASPVRSPPSPQMSIKQTGTKFSDRFRTRR